MSDNFLSSGWHLPSAAWPYWIPTGPWEETRTTSPPPVALWGQYPLVPSHSTTPPSSSRGILGNFGQRASSGILGNLGQPDDDWDRSIPPSAQTAATWNGSGGILGDFGQSVDQQAVDPWLAMRDVTAWNRSAPPTPSVLPPKFPPAWSSGDLGASEPDWLRSVRQQPNARETLASPAISSRLWPLESQSSRTSTDPSVASSYYPSLRSQPSIPTEAAVSTAWNFPEPPNAPSWRASAPVSRDRAALDPMGAQADPVGQLELKGIQLAGMDTPFPGLRPPIPPWVLPGGPEWTEHFIRGWQGLINALRRSGRGGGGRRSNDSDDDDECSERLQREIARCYDRTDEYAHQDFLDACIRRAKYRWGLCVQNKGRPDPHEPPEWGPKDEEIWRNFGR
jgi:hypothetical protein